MKIKALLVSSLFLALGVQAQDKKATTTCKKNFIGVHTGIDNPNGLLGIDYERAVAPKFTVGAGVGLGGWGTKAYVQGRYYFAKKCYTGNAVTASLSHSTGVEGVELNSLDNNYGMSYTFLDLDPINTLALTYDHLWGLGKTKRSKLHLAVGYAFRLNTMQYRPSGIQATLPGFDLTTDSKTALKITAPGGPVISFGYYFGF